MRLALLHPIKWVSSRIFHLQEPVREHAHLYLLAITFCIPFTLKTVNFLMEMKKPAQCLLAQQLQITKNAKDLHQQLLGQQLPQHLHQVNYLFIFICASVNFVPEALKRISAFYFSCFTGQCTTGTYVKSNGQCACGFFLSGTISWFQAKDQCASQGAQLPEIYSSEDNDNIFQLRVLTVKLILNIW